MAQSPFPTPLNSENLNVSFISPFSSACLCWIHQSRCSMSLTSSTQSIFDGTVVQFSVVCPACVFMGYCSCRQREKYNHQPPAPCTCPDRRFVGHIISNVTLVDTYSLLLSNPPPPAPTTIAACKSLEPCLSDVLASSAS